MEAELDVPIRKMIALANEGEYMNEFVPYIDHTNLIKKYTKARKYQYSKLNFPVITDREVYFYGEGFDRLDENGTITLISKSVNNDEEFKQKYGITIPTTSQYIRLDFNHYVYQIEPLSEDRCKVRAVTNVNPYVKFVPQSIINYIGRKFAFYLFEKMITKANKGFENSVW